MTIRVSISYISDFLLLVIIILSVAKLVQLKFYISHFTIYIT